MNLVKNLASGMNVSPLNKPRTLACVSHNGLGWPPMQIVGYDDYEKRKIGGGERLGWR